MKSISLALAFIGCGHVTDDAADSAYPENITRNQASSSTFIDTSVESMHPPRTGTEPGVRVGTDDTKPEIDATVLHCTTPAYEYGVFLGDIDPPMSDWIDPAHVGASDSEDDSADEPRTEQPSDVHRIVITQKGDEHFAVVQTGHPHDRTDVVSTVRHKLSYFENADSDTGLYLEWNGVSIYGWKQEEQVVIHGYGWGDFSRPTAEPDATPAPPCGFDIEVTCWDPNDTEPQFQYDTETGLCTDEHGVEGLNETSVAYIRETKDGECARLQWQTLNEYLSFDTELVGWNLRGANLEGSTLGHELGESQETPFVYLAKAQLEGADLSGLDMPAGMIQGTIDDHTKLPNVDCSIDDKRVTCDN